MKKEEKGEEKVKPKAEGEGKERIHIPPPTTSNQTTERKEKLQSKISKPEKIRNKPLTMTPVACAPGEVDKITEKKERENSKHSSCGHGAHGNRKCGLCSQ